MLVYYSTTLLTTLCSVLPTTVYYSKVERRSRLLVTAQHLLPKRSFQNLFLVNMASSTTVWIVGTLFSVLSVFPVSFAQSPTIGFISPDVVTDIGKLLSKMTEKRLRKAENKGNLFLRYRKYVWF